MLDSLLAFMGLRMRPSQGDIDRDQESPLVVGLRATMTTQKESIEFWQKEAKQLDFDLKDKETENAKLRNALTNADKCERVRLEQLREIQAANDALVSALDDIAERAKSVKSSIDGIAVEPYDTRGIIDTKSYGSD
jgi:hypothetical protein